MRIKSLALVVLGSLLLLQACGEQNSRKPAAETPSETQDDQQDSGDEP